MDEMIQENSELAHERKDLVEEIDESVEIEQQKDISYGLFPGGRGWRTQSILLFQKTDPQRQSITIFNYELFDSTS